MRHHNQNSNTNTIRFIWELILLLLKFSVFVLWLWHFYHKIRGFSGLGERTGEGIGEGVRKRRRSGKGTTFGKSTLFWALVVYHASTASQYSYSVQRLSDGIRRIKLKLMMLTPALRPFGSRISLHRLGDFVRGAKKPQGREVAPQRQSSSLPLYFKR